MSIAEKLEIEVAICTGMTNLQVSVVWSWQIRSSPLHAMITWPTNLRQCYTSLQNASFVTPRSSCSCCHEVRFSLVKIHRRGNSCDPRIFGTAFPSPRHVGHMNFRRHNIRNRWSAIINILECLTSDKKEKVTGRCSQQVQVETEDLEGHLYIF